MTYYIFDTGLSACWQIGHFYVYNEPEPIMLLVLLPEIPIIFTHYSYFIPMPSPIIPVTFFKFLCQWQWGPCMHCIAP